MAGSCPAVKGRDVLQSGKRFQAIVVSLFVSCSALVIFCGAWPRVEIRTPDGGLFRSFYVFPGETFSTEYIHSIQQTPVLDFFAVNGGRLWVWEERTQSTNAGLPTEAPPNGRFYIDTPWLCYQGGRLAIPVLNLRVGNENFGRNVLLLPSGERLELYRDNRTRDRRLTFMVKLE